jgi:serine/threonine protein kinase/tetratricopeptide (TPR) repeat protein
MSRSDREPLTESLAMRTPSGEAAVHLRAGDTVGRYRLIRELGRGGMGVVFLAHDSVLDRQVALKVILAAEAGIADRRRFEREARSAARLHHPGIATVFDVGVDDGRSFLAMEYVQGETLADRLKRGPLPAEALLSLAQQLAAALAAAHDAGVVHRDLKPGNIMCAADGRVRLLDFGLARAASVVDADSAAAEPLTHTGVLVGTPAYMAPEQARGDRTGTASDVFALGVVLHEAATGRSAFRGPNVFAVLASVLSETPPSLSTVRPDLPAGFDDVVMRCLRKDPSERFPHAADVVRALASVAVRDAKQPTDLKAPSSSSSSTSSSSSSSSSPASTLVAGRAAVLPWRNTSRDPSHDWLGSGIADTIAHELRRSRGVAVVEDARVGAALGAIVGSGQAPEPFEIARALDAEWVVAGSYQVAGSRVRIVGSVGHVPDATMTPCDRIDGAVDDIFDLQDRLVEQVRAIVGAARAATSSTEVRLAPHNAVAYEWYGRGMLARQAWTAESSAEAERCFATAVQHDPAYALAHAALGQMRLARSMASGAPPLVDAIGPFERAVELDPGLAEARSWLSHALMLLGRLDASVEHARAAFALDPNHAFTAMNLGLASGAAANSGTGGPDAYVETITALRRAVQIEPASGACWSNLGIWSMTAGDLAQSRAAFERALALEGRPLAPDMEKARWVGARVFLGAIEMFEDRLFAAERELERGLAALRGDQHIFARTIEAYGGLTRAECALRGGRHGEARAGFEAVIEHATRAAGKPGAWQHLVRAHAGRTRALALQGDRSAARAALGSTLSLWSDETMRRLSGYAAGASLTAYDIASAVAAVGDHDSALAALDAAHHHAWCCTAMLDGDPCFEALRDHPRLLAARDRADAATAAVIGAGLIGAAGGAGEGRARPARGPAV